MSNISLKMTGFHALIVVTPSPSLLSTVTSQGSAGLSSTSLANEPPSQPNNMNFVLPPASIFCTFLDGGVGLYDLRKRKWNFLRDMVSCNQILTVF